MTLFRHLDLLLWLALTSISSATDMLKCGKLYNYSFNLVIWFKLFHRHIERLLNFSVNMFCFGLVTNELSLFESWQCVYIYPVCSYCYIGNYANCLQISCALWLSTTSQISERLFEMTRRKYSTWPPFLNIILFSIIHPL